MQERSVAAFDLDMTLVDSRDSILAAFAALATEMHVDIDVDAVRRRLGLKLEQELAHRFDPADVAAAAACHRRHHRKEARSTRALPRALRALDASRAAGFATAVVTAKHTSTVGTCLTAAGIAVDHLFCHVHGAEKAAVLVRCAAAFYVGDTPDDMAAARAVHVTAVGVTTGSFAGASLRGAGANFVLGDLADFPSWLDATYSTGDDATFRALR